MQKNKVFCQIDYKSTIVKNMNKKAKCTKFKCKIIDNKHKKWENLENNSMKSTIFMSLFTNCTQILTNPLNKI